VIHIDLKGKKILEESEDFVWVESQAGESWHEFVLDYRSKFWRFWLYVTREMLEPRPVKTLVPTEPK
jgi:hypothetical protein